MRVAVTGGTGFLGRRVVEQLRTDGHDVVLVARPGRGSTLDRPHAPVLEVDFDDPPSDLHARAGRPEVVIHLAWARLDDGRSPTHLDVELPRHLGMARALAGDGLRRIVATGSSSEYGIVHGPVGEDTPTHPTLTYGAAKVGFHAALIELADEVGAELVWARMFPLHGEDQPERELLGRLRVAVERGERTFAMSLGEQLRDYLDVTTAGRIVATLAAHPHATGVYNVCSGRPISVRRLAEEWCRTNAPDLELRLGEVPMPTHESPAFWGDRSRLDALLGVGSAVATAEP